MVRAPDVDQFPDFPACWYLLCATRDLRVGPISRNLLGKRLAAYRGARGTVVVLDALCAHLGADLGNGQVVGDNIRCPFHHWEYAPGGRCTHIPAQAHIPSFARQASYPVVERHGFVFVFNGPQPLFPLPFFSDALPEDFLPGRPFRFVAQCSWFMLAANGFDEEHFRAVHDRTLLDPPEVDCPAPFARRVRYRASVTGNSIFDRLIRRFLGETVNVSITNWGGPFILVTGFFRKARSYIMIATTPLENQQTFVDVIVFSPRSRRRIGKLLTPFGLWTRRLFTRAFMQDDIDRLGGIRYNREGLLESDLLMIEFFQWLTNLPQLSSVHDHV